MKIDEIDTVLYVGAGTMGSANSLVAAIAGYEVILHDARPENLETVADRATWSEPREPAAGVPWVVINGEVVVEDGRHVGGCHGQVLRASS